MNGLKINFVKLVLIKFGKNDIWGSEVAKKLGCKLVELFIIYFGFLYGVNFKIESIRRFVIKKVEERLVIWKVKGLLRVGRFILIKFVFNSFLLYYLSLFKMFRKVLLKILRI